jgi:hypothetical protein
MADTRVARHMWTRFESVHAVTYFTPEAAAAYEAAGLRGYWRGYFGGRAAPMGAVDATPVVSAFYGFAPSMVARALPDVWTRAAPARVLAARRDGAVAALERLVTDPATVAEAADLAEAAVALMRPEGRPIGAANLALPRDPDAPPLARLWQATTTMREHRGDGHVAALVAYGFDGPESAVWRTEPWFRAQMRAYRGWTDEEWDAATARLRDRGFLDADGAHTPDGDAAYAAVERATDEAAGRIWQELGAERTRRLDDLLTPIAVAAYRLFPEATPLHLPDPATVAP